MKKRKGISILGSTGSIGVNTLDVISKFSDKFDVICLGANRNISLFEKQVKLFKPKEVAIFDSILAERLEKKLGNREVFTGIEGLNRIAVNPDVDILVSAIVGAIGLIPTYAGIKAGKDIALANKESMVIGGDLLTKEAKKKKVSILPIDSEHSAIFQSIEGHRKEDIKRIILTASGGPFRHKSKKEMEKVKPEEALKHPNWRMGKKITIDCATLMNKGLEAIEARWLFNIDIERIHVLVHPESVIHSMVEYIDGSVVAQLGIPDMRIPISLALDYPERLPNGFPSLDLAKLGKLTFFEPDLDKFPCLSLAYEAGKKGGTMPAVLNASNEEAVLAYLDRKISFNEIPKIIKNVMKKHKNKAVKKLEDILEADCWARGCAREMIERS